MGATKIDLDPGFGFAEFTIGDKTSQPVDLYAANDKYVTLRDKHAVPVAGSTDPTVQVMDVNWDALWTEWRAYLETFGFPTDGLSIAMMPRTVEAIQDAIANLRKKDPQPAS